MKLLFLAALSLITLSSVNAFSMESNLYCRYDGETDLLIPNFDIFIEGLELDNYFRDDYKICYTGKAKQISKQIEEGQLSVYYYDRQIKVVIEKKRDSKKTNDIFYTNEIGGSPVNFRYVSPGILEKCE